MKKYDFDRIIIRKGSGALKYDALGERYGNPDLWPLWVADMDFETPDFIIDALKKRLDHPILGYTVVPESYWESIINWLKDLHGWDVRKESLRFIPGIVKGIGFVLEYFTRPGDKIIIQPPVYHPFRLLPEGTKRTIINNPLILDDDGRYEMDLEGLRKILKDEECKVLILSNPHNPGGRIWPKETLASLAEICHDNGVLVISDEIHGDMTLWGERYYPFPTVSEKAAKCSITFGAPSKTFNIAGVVSSYSVITEEKIRDRFYSWLDANEFSEPTIFAPIATEAAFSDKGKEWRRQMLEYVEGNINFVIDYCEKNLPGIKAQKPEASFLVWLDCRDLGLDHSRLIELFEKKAQLALNDGEMFGPGGEGFMRMNVGCPRLLLQEALGGLAKVLKE